MGIVQVIWTTVMLVERMFLCAVEAFDDWLGL